MIDYYHRNKLQDNKFTIEEIKAFIYELIPLEGNAIITHIGGNGRFKFELDGIEYISEFTNNVCTDKKTILLLKKMINIMIILKYPLILTLKRCGVNCIYIILIRITIGKSLNILNQRSLNWNIHNNINLK